MKRNKILSAVIAVMLAGVMLFGGTFAWQSISQTALNEVSAVMNPGGRLHDDFTDVTDEDSDLTRVYNKDVYVENFTELVNNGVQVYARVRLDEYMEMGPGAGLLNEDGTEKSDKNQAVSLVEGAELANKKTWTPHVFGEDDVFHQYWSWEFGGETVYMPTFNKNKDSLEADINGSFAENFEDYLSYAVGDTESLVALYDADNDPDGNEEKDELAEAGISAEDVINRKNPLDASWDKYVERVEETHTAKATLSAEIISLADWQAMVEADGGYDAAKHGGYWVYDEDGWAYWSAPIDPDSATGLLLSGISRTTKIINQDWYYAINVVAQFITGDDMGQDDNSGFYDVTEGKAPSAAALQLLDQIGVQVTKAEVNTADGLIAALEQGGIVTMTGDIDVAETLEIGGSTVLDLNGNTLYVTPEKTLWNEDAGAWSLISVKGEDTTLVIDGEGSIVARENDSYCVDVQDGAMVVINGGIYNGNISAVYVYEGEAVINGGTFLIQQTDPEQGYKYVLNCYDENYANGTANISVRGGTFYDFDPSSTVENTEPGHYLAEGYAVEKSDDGNTATYTVYTVVRDAAAESDAAGE